MSLRTITDFTMLPDDIITAMINSDNGTSIVNGTLAYDNPVTVVAGNPFYTELDVYGAPGSGFNGSVKIHYKRLPLTYKIHGDLLFDVGTSRYMRDLIPAINLRYGINLTPNDYIDVEVAQPGYLENIPLTLTAAPSSLVFIGSIEIMTTDLQLTGIPLSSVITDIYLDTIDDDSQNNCDLDVCTVPPAP